MDKEEFRIKLEQINHLVEVKDYKGAMEVVDSIDWRRVKNVRTLCVVGEIYAANKRYEDSRDIFLLAYHRSSLGKNILYRLVEISLKMGDIEEANEYYEEYRSVAPNDNTRYILKYKILKEQNAPLEEQISVLEEYKEKEFTEKWSYELAKLYYRLGEKEKCKDLCNEMILWFSEGSYVMKALDLKMRMGIMTDEEKEKYEKQFIPKLYTHEEVKEIKQRQQEELTEEFTVGESEEEDVRSEETVSDTEAPVPVEEPEPVVEQEEEGTAEDAGAVESGDLSSESDKEDEDIIDGLSAIEEGEKEEDTSSDDLRESLSDLLETDEQAVQKVILEDPDGDEESLEDKEGPVIGSISLKNEKDLKDAETIQEKISKGIREFFSNMRKKEPSITEEESKNLEDSDEEDKDIKIVENIRRKVRRKPADEIPSLENEEEAGKLRQTDEEDELTDEELEDEIPEEETEEEIFSEEEEKEEVSEENLNAFETETKEDFDLEDTILAAATEQGIEIPEEKISEVPDLKTDDIAEEMEKVADRDLIDDGVSVFRKREKPIREGSDSEEEILLDPNGEDQSVEAGEPIIFESVLEEEEPDDRIVPVMPGTVRDHDMISLEELENSRKKENKTAEIPQREKELREEEIKLFSYFVKVPGMKEQLVETLCDVQEGASDRTSNSGNIIVMGGVESGKTRLISALVPAICKELHLEAAKVAYVFAEQINDKNIDAMFEKLRGGFFVIENANQLNIETAEKLEKAMEKDTDGLIVILEDNKIGMRKMLARYPRLAKKFTSTINIPVFTNDELATFARVYALENGYRIDNMGMLALYNLIGANQKADMPMNIGQVKTLVDNAIARVSGGGVFKKNAAKKRTDEEGYIVLNEKDFK